MRKGSVMDPECAVCSAVVPLTWHCGIGMVSVWRGGSRNTPANFDGGMFPNKCHIYCSLNYYTISLVGHVN